MKKVFQGIVARYFSRYEGEVKYRFPTLKWAKYSMFTKEINCHERGQVKLTVDVDGLLSYLGRKALANKGGFAKLEGGLVTARVVKDTRNEEVISVRELSIPDGAEIINPGEKS